MAKPVTKLLKHQHDFVTDITTPFLGLVGGYGCGKTYSFVMKAIHLASLNVGKVGCLCEPTFPMIRNVLIPMLRQVLEDTGIKYTVRSHPTPEFHLHFPSGTTKLLLLSATNENSLVGLNLAFFGVDEIDTIPQQLATDVWRVLVSRLRAGKVYQGFTTSTPEGYGFLYNYFVVDAVQEDGTAKTDRRFIKARTADNHHLPASFIPSLLAQYPPNLIKAYLEGEFTNLNSGTVYYCFDRKQNHSDVSLDDPKLTNIPLHVGIDFNVNKMSAIVCVQHQGVPVAVAEHLGARNTEDLIAQLKHHYPRNHITIYPDSSGQAEKSNASVTDIQLLQQAGFVVKARPKNPLVRDRVGSVNAMFKDGYDRRKLFVNTKKCPKLTQSLEQQAYDEAGKPQKTHDVDHPLDAFGYFVHWHYPIQGRPSATVYR